MSEHSYEDIVKPELLYHYTTADTFRKIIESPQIRFNRLDRMDDPFEAVSEDLGCKGQLIFVSSWTSSSREISKFWWDYAEKGTGVRIELPTHPFETNVLSNTIFQNEPFSSEIPPDLVFDDEVTAVPHEKLILEPVTYTDDPNRKFQKMWHPGPNGGETLLYSVLWRYKHTKWDYQEEWRYIIPVFPVPFSIRNVDAEVYLNTIAPYTSKMIRSKNSINKTEVFLKMKSEALNRMVVRFGPTISDADRKDLVLFTGRRLPGIKFEASTIEEKDFIKLFEKNVV